MPKKIFSRWLPAPYKVVQYPLLRWLGPAINDPNLFHINRTSISLSFFIGLFCAYLPIPGQTIIAALLALWWRTNLPLAAALIWISNPITIAPMFYLSYQLGNFILGAPESSGLAIELSWDWMVEQGAGILLPLLIGSLICGLTLGLTGYFVIRYLWRWKVINKWEERKLARQKKSGSSNKEDAQP